MSAIQGLRLGLMCCVGSFFCLPSLSQPKNPQISQPALSACANGLLESAADQPGVKGWCKPGIQGAPTIWLEKSDSLLARSMPHMGCPTCAVSIFQISGPLSRIDFAELQQLLTNKLKESGEQIAFVGFSSGEILVTTAPRPAQNAGSSSYYQALFATSSCGNIETTKLACGIYGSAQKLMTQPASSKSRTPTVAQDDLCRSLEDVVVTYVHTLF
jgi:hypothetical protein